jgi:branched-chain amino acid aminotransferase
MEKKATHIWLDGKLVPWEQATIHVMSHTIHYGSGAFEGIRCYVTKQGPALFRLSDHVERLLDSFAHFGVAIPWTKLTLERAIIDTIKINNMSNCYIRPLVFFGPESLVLNPGNSSVHCAIIAINFEKYLGSQAINVGISAIRRINADSVPIHSKVNGYYVNSIFAHIEAKDRGFDEALLLDHKGNIAEGSVANIFLIINGKLITPETGAILPGLTRASIITIAQKLGISVEERALQLKDIEFATEAFFTGTASEITPIKTIEKKQLLGESGLITKELIAKYEAIIHGNDTEYESWLTFIDTVRN